MGYQALLFCPDEKLARIVAQVFTDLDFTVEAVQEPFTAVKKLMAQRYNALVVDCENESNASLLFKSARNSSSNQGILAIAVVEGQAGVAKAYRIGANLVLTKPINVEQAKGTLRVARGLLKKSAEGSAAPANQPSPAMPPTTQRPDAASTAASQPTFAATSSAPAPVIPPSTTHGVPEAEPSLPALAASAHAQESAALSSETPAKPVAAEVPAASAVPEVSPVSQPAWPAPVATTPAPGVGAATGQGAAVAPARVKDFPAPEKSAPELETSAPHFDLPLKHDSGTIGSTPSFSMETADSAKSGGAKKVLIAAVVLVAIAAGGYIGWTKLYQHTESAPAAQPVSVANPAPAPAPPVERPAMEALRTTTPSPAASQPQAALSVTPPATAPDTKSSKPAVPRIQLDSQPEPKPQSVTPLVVKSGPKAPRASAEDAAPSPLAVADADPNALESVVGSSRARTTQVSLATVKISQGVSQGLLIKRVDPQYPPNARAMRLQGAVVLDATIDREGKVSNVSVVKGDPVLTRAALDAVRQWRYKPYKLDGQPVEIQTQITINFKLPN